MIWSSAARRLFLVLALMAVVCAPRMGWTGEVHFGDGNVLKGTIASFKEGELTFSTDYAKKVKIPVDQIQTITTEEIVTIELKEGAILKGRLVTKEDGSLGIELMPMKEVVSLRWDAIRYINKTPRRWKGNVFLGGSIQTGNVEVTSISGGAEAERKWERDRLSLRAFHNYVEQDGEINSRNTFGAFKFDHFFTDRFYGLISTELLKDEFKNLNLRAIIGGGVGYKFWENDTKNLEFELGVTYFSEDLRVGQDERFTTARFASNLMYLFNESLKFTNFLLVYPKIAQPAEYRLRNEASLNTKFTEHWSFKLTHILDQNSKPSPGIKKTDQTFLFSLQFNFGD